MTRQGVLRKAGIELFFNRSSTVRCNVLKRREKAIPWANETQKGDVERN